jgi:hypothetical protein
VIGNLPWVTNSVLGAIDGANLPTKSNFQKYKGIDALTGKSNFDISEWMTIQVVNWLRKRSGYLAILLKTTVARRILRYIYETDAPLSGAAIFQIDAMKAFGAAIDACLLFCDFASAAKSNDCAIFETINAAEPIKIIGFRDGVLLSDVRASKEKKPLLSSIKKARWRSGVKHDCAKVMEFVRESGNLYNGFGEKVDIETDYVFPLLKGADVANGRVGAPKRRILVPQRFVGQDTSPIKDTAPKTWAYLKAHQALLDRRKSKIYKGKPLFSIFGVGDYAFAEWKAAIGSLYKRLQFVVVGPFEDKPVIFDDTVYFLPCKTQEEAQTLCDLLNSEESKAFYSAHIFWDSKRPITASVLGKIDIEKLAELYGKGREISGCLEQKQLLIDGF